MAQYRPDLSQRFTHRTSKRMKELVDAILRRSELNEAEVLRYCFEAILPIAARDGMSKIMAMREEHLRQLAVPARPKAAAERRRQAKNKIVYARKTAA